MRLLLMKRNVSVLCRSVLRFVDISACTFMACFLNCFRVRDHRSATNLGSDSSLAKSKKSQDSQNHLSSLYMSEEKAAASSTCDKGRFDLDSIYIDKGLRDEARFLKACGTIPETPIEIRKASQRQNSPLHSGSSPFHSWISSTSAIAFHLDESRSPMKACEKLERPLFTTDHTPSSCVIDDRDSERISSTSGDADADVAECIRTALKEDMHISGRPMLTAGKTKSVRFECDLDKSHSSTSPKNSSSRKAEMGGKVSFTVSSPNPTPLKLSEEMQTPGTIYPVNMESGGRGKARIRSQFVHSVSNLMESTINENTEGDRTFGVATITPSDKKNEISPKLWDGNGIPNSTRKYKEDQKVSWHATPFEVRLEKALSEEGGQSLYPRRNLEVMEEDDEEEENTEISQLHHSAQPNSVVSF
ncbi:unnamed protein product [Cochlearia groenlandica]